MATTRTDSIHAALKTYADSIHAALGVVGSPSVWPEDQLKSPVKVLLESIGRIFGKVVVVTSEATQEASEGEESGGRVDAAVVVGTTLKTALLTGHIELKAPSKSGDPRKLTGKHDKAQWAKFQKLPNLIYTNGREWTLQRTGKQEGSPLTFVGDPVIDGAAAVSREDAERFETFVEVFFIWQPIVPKSSKQIADLLAPLCRLLRAEAVESLKKPNSALSKLAKEMRKYLFPGAANEVVADAFAQTYTYALLIARFEGADPLTVSTAETALQEGHGLLSEVLGLLDSPTTHAEVATSADTILRVISAVQPKAIITKYGDNPWLYFYEEFLAAYDPALRKQVGAYYTPVEVVRAQVAIVREVLTQKFGKTAAFADEGVITLDPAVGTGTYPLEILQSVLDAVPAHATGSVPALLRRAANNLYGIEYLIGPYSVAHLRLSRFLADYGVQTTSSNPLNILLSDTLASHEDNDNAMLPEVFGYEEILEEREAARELKVNTRVVVCIGNPPYLRGKKADAGAALGGWVTMRRMPSKGQKVRDPNSRRLVVDKGQVGIIRDFIEPVIAAGHGGDLKNLYNAYVYFWRWALWKVFEQERSDVAALNVPLGSGIVSFISASSFIRGPGFTGMRQHMRSLLDEIWIIDLGGDNRGGRKSENVFAIETPVAITVGVRYGEPRPDVPATMHYTSLADLPAVAKRTKLASLAGFSDRALHWQDVMSDWQDPFLPIADKEYLSWPALTDLFPWQVSGSQIKRSWPIGETEAVLRERWNELTGPLAFDQVTGDTAKDASARAKLRAELFKESRDRKVNSKYPDLMNHRIRLPELVSLKPGTTPEIKRYAYRSFDRQYVIADNRVGDFMRATLWRSHSEKQLYLTSLLTKELGRGPAATVARDVPDMDVFCNRGGKDVIPLWRGSDATEPNVTIGLLDVLSAEYDVKVEAPDLFGYCYGLLATSAYVDTFWDALTVPGPHIPLTKDPALFARVRDHGEELLRLHTIDLYDADAFAVTAPGVAAYSKPISEGKYPESFSYDPAERTLRVGDGEYTNVSPEVWGFSVSGLQIVDSWLGYRLKKRSGKSSSKLDEIRPSSWPDLGGEQLLRLLWTLQKTISLNLRGAELLKEVQGSSLYASNELPAPTEAEREWTEEALASTTLSEPQ